MAGLVTFDASEFARFAQTFAAGPQVVSDESRVAMERSAILVQNTAKHNLQQQQVIDTGRLINSVAYQVTPFSATIGTNVTHAPSVEGGRRAGSAMPPPGSLTGWLSRHGLSTALDFVVRRSIARRGIPARPFLFPALERSTRQIEREFDEALLRIMRRLIGS